VVNDSADVTSSGRSFHVCRPAIGRSIRKDRRAVTEPDKVWDTYTKNRTYRRTFTSAVRGESGGPTFPVKNEFAIGGDEISHSLEGFTCTLQSLLSRYSITFSIPPLPTVTISMQIWTNYETHIFKKRGYVFSGRAGRHL